MKKRESMTKAWKRQWRASAIWFVKEVANVVLKKYVAPVPGLRRKAIGFSYSKKMAACLTPLYIPDRRIGVSLKGIARMSGVSHGVLLVWRTQPDFKEEVRKQCQLLANIIFKAVADELPFPRDLAEVRNMSVNMLFFLDPLVETNFFTLLLKTQSDEWWRKNERNWQPIIEYIASYELPGKEFLTLRLSERGIEQIKIHCRVGVKSRERAMKFHAQVYPELVALDRKIRSFALPPLAEDPKVKKGGNENEKN